MTDAEPFDWDAFSGRKTPDDFERHPRTGAPWVNHPSRRVKDGSRPARVQYGRPSSAYDQIDQQYNLTKWAEREVVRGIVDLMVNGELLADERALVAHYDPDSPDDRRDLDSLVVRAKDRSGALTAARRGTFVHVLTALRDEDRDVLAMIERGDALGIPKQVCDAVLEAWTRLLTDNELTIIHTEERVVDDEHRLAGTLDRVARLGRSLTLPMAGGRFVTIPAGTTLVLDVKTGGLTLNSDGTPAYWLGYAAQIASYAAGRRYVIDADGERRARWHRKPSQVHGLIAHIDIAGALDTDVVTARLVYVDLRAGREALRMVVGARNYAKRRNVIGLVDGGPIAAVTVDTDGPSQLEAILEASIEQLRDEGDPRSSPEDEDETPW